MHLFRINFVRYYRHQPTVAGLLVVRVMVGYESADHPIGQPSASLSVSVVLFAASIENLVNRGDPVCVDVAVNVVLLRVMKKLNVFQLDVVVTVTGRTIKQVRCLSKFLKQTISVLPCDTAEIPYAAYFD